MGEVTSPTTRGELVHGTTGDWEIIIGLEVHAQVTRKSKLFSGASAEFGGEPNDHVSLVDAAMPGMLPVINAFCVEQAVRTGLGLKAQINLRFGVRPQELFLSRSSPGLSDLAVPAAGCRRGPGVARHAGRRDGGGRHRTVASGAGCRQELARSASRMRPSSISTGPASR